ncbi:MAG: hypothetical protein HQM08_05760 [Candidatus Riflebacteria bacterium]|nr:hypothetical protein [Candidatus Riflebacteria bacterium]
MTSITCKTDLKTSLKSKCSRWAPNDTLAIISGNREAPEGAFWLWNPSQGILERLLIPYPEDASTLFQVILNRPPQQWKPATVEGQQSLSRYMLFPHTAFQISSGVVASGPLNGINTYLLDIKAKKYSAICSNESSPYWTYSPTPGINAAKNKLYTTRWLQEIDKQSAEKPQHSDIICIDLNSKTEKICFPSPISDNVHQVVVMQDQRHLLLNEFQTGLNGPIPELSAIAPNKHAEILKQIGVKSSRLALVDLETGDSTTWECPCPAPAHLVFDPDDPNVFFLACHNMVIASGQMYLFGPGCLIKLRIKGKEFHVEGHYTHSTFHRLSTHEIVTYHGRKAIAVTVFPNRCEIIDTESFTRLALIDLYPIARIDANGLALPDHPNESAFSVCGVNSPDLLVLSGSQRIYVVDTSANTPVIETLVYNTDPNWVVRAHMALLT